ncbi:MAG: acyltransferase [Bacteroidales bacterium]
MKSEQVNYNGIDDLRFVATVGVILLHTSAGLLSLYGKVPQDYWLIGLFYNALTRFCVPMFVMISGALLLSKEYKAIDFFRKRFTRILLPFLFYSVIYLVYNLIIRLLYGHHNSTHDTIHWLIYKIKGGVSYHFWFVYMILGLYLIIPIIGHWVRNRSQKQLIILLILWFSYNLMQLFGLKITFLFSQTLDYAGYLILGYYLANKDFENTHWAKTVGIILFSSGYLVNVVVLASHSKNNQLYSNFSPTIVAMAIGAYLFIKNANLENQFWIKIRTIVCQYSFGIYLIHILILKWLSIAHTHWNFAHPAIAIPITTILTLILSTLFVLGVFKLPFGKYISG